MAEQTIYKAYRGPASGLPTLEAGQLGWTTDTNKLYVGTGTGNVLVGPSTGAGTGDVIGPPSSVSGHVLTFADATGKVVQDGGAALITAGWFDVDENGDLEPSTTFLLTNALEADVNGDLMPV